VLGEGVGPELGLDQGRAHGLAAQLIGMVLGLPSVAELLP
jgi:hypothetical protein